MPKISEYTPGFISKNICFENLFKAQQSEVDKISFDIEDIANQCFIEKATWGLDYWETILNISIDEAKPLDQRRSLIKASLRGQGTITVEVIQSVSESFANTKVRVKEEVEPYTFEIKFIGSVGTPPNLDDLKKSINKIKPAHLLVRYAFSFLIIRDIHNKMTIRDINSTLIDKFAGGNKNG